MAHFFGWLIAELMEFALFSALSRIVWKTWTVIIISTILLALIVTGDLSWPLAGGILGGTVIVALILYGVDFLLVRTVGSSEDP
jgi:hypothetical protein